MNTLTFIIIYAQFLLYYIITSIQLKVIILIFFNDFGFSNIKKDLTAHFELLDPIEFIVYQQLLHNSFLPHHFHLDLHQ